jgi:hypothetical protein
MMMSSVQDLECRDVIEASQVFDAQHSGISLAKQDWLNKLY